MRRLFWPLTLLAILLLSIALNVRFQPGGEASGDAREYLGAALSLRTTGHLPAVGREPGYPLLLAGLMATTRLGRIGSDCLQPSRPCDAVLFQPAQWTNLILALGAAVLTGWTAWRLTGSLFAATIGFGYLALNQQMLRGRWELLSDHLALFLFALLLTLLVEWLRSPTNVRAVAAGLAAAALVLTKAIWVWLIILAAVLLFSSGRNRPRGAWLGLVVGGLPLIAWAARNAAGSGTFALTDQRGGIALSTREVFVHLTSTERFCGFLYWTRGIGDDLAARLCPLELWRRFDIGAPGGFYSIGQDRYEPWVARVASERGLDLSAARKLVDGELLAAMAAHPIGWLTSLPMLVWRGLWIDEFVVFGFPALVIGTAWALRHRYSAWLVGFGLGWFSLLGYAALSLNIPRYQVPAVPALALAAAWACWQLAKNFRKRQSGRR
jgi:4-amino-4-deoxy-L-arabinose transferase-like glycosyltransferase